MSLVAHAQIYDRHVTHANEMLKRYEKSAYSEHTQPRLELATDETDFYSFTIDDFVMHNYEPIKPQLTLELGI